MAFNAEEFRSSFGKNGPPARTNAYDVRVRNVPSGALTALGQDIPFNESSLIYRCESAELPGRTIGTTEFKDYGPVRKIAYGSIYNDVSLTFIVDDSFREKDIFDGWHKFIVDDNAESQTSDVKYYDSYAKNSAIDIVCYGYNDTPTKWIKLEEAWPVNIASMPVAWGPTGEFHKIVVDIAYRYWFNLDIPNPAADTSLSGGPQDGITPGLVERTIRGINDFRRDPIRAVLNADRNQIASDAERIGNTVAGNAGISATAGGVISSTFSL